jgi:hypothetical protein
MTEASEFAVLEKLGPEGRLLDSSLEVRLPLEARVNIWKSALRILEHGPLGIETASNTGLALGFVQSGKTTSITALMAAAADRGYKIIVAFLGSTNLLLDQNQRRIDSALGISTRRDYQWVSHQNPSGSKKAKEIGDRLALGRTVFLPVLKHAGRIDKLTEVLSHLELVDETVLIIDDEADQASLNTATKQKDASRTYQAITDLRDSAPRNLYVQYTATPYAPLLIDKDDHLRPDFVEFLLPGAGYTGGKEFFLDHAATVIRNVPMLEEQSTKAPLSLPNTLLNALANFLAGSAMLLVAEPQAAPVSMLVHSTHRNDIQSRYEFLIRRKIEDWRKELSSITEVGGLPSVFLDEREKLLSAGVHEVEENDFLASLKVVLHESYVSLVNSTEAMNRINWNVSPIHILVGGNKLDRGFTVEGLTVTYMNRKPSNQIDTLEQRARAFGYRGDLIPYCQFFASKRTVQVLRDIVFTEYDLRSKLHDHIEGGGSVDSWAEEIGLLLPEGAVATRASVITELSRHALGWKSLRYPDLSSSAVAHNARIVEEIGLEVAEEVHYGSRRRFRTISMTIDDATNLLIGKWSAPEFGADWRRELVLDAMQRYPHRSQPVRVILLEEDGGTPRIRKWDPMVGFINLFQGRDQSVYGGSASYPGDRSLPDIDSNPDQVSIQVHRVQRRGHSDPTNLFTLAVYLGNRQLVRTIRSVED